MDRNAYNQTGSLRQVLELYGHHLGVGVELLSRALGPCFPFLINKAGSAHPVLQLHTSCNGVRASGIFVPVGSSSFVSRMDASTQDGCR